MAKLEGRNVDLQPQAMIAASAQQLGDRMHHRQQLVAIQVAEKNRLTQASPMLRADIEEPREQLQQRLKALNEQIQTLGQQPADWQRKAKILHLRYGLCRFELPHKSILTNYQEKI